MKIAKHLPLLGNPWIVLGAPATRSIQYP